MPDFTAPGARTDHEDTDPDLGGLEAGSTDSDLDSLEAELLAEVTPTTDVAHPGRPGYALRCRLDFTGKDLDSLRKRSKDKRMSDGVDGTKFSGLLLALTTTAIIRKGEPLELDGTSPVTFTTRALQDLYGTGSAYDTVRAFYAGRDGFINAAAARVMDEAGWGDEADVADPTE